MKRTVLIIDDEPKIVETVTLLLTSQGYEVVGAADGRQGLELATAQPPRLILLDVMMPKLDGFSVLAHLKREAATRAIPVVMLSAKGESDSLLLSQQLRADDYLIKPIIVDDLLRAVRQYVC